MKKILFLVYILTTTQFIIAQKPGYYNGTENKTGDELKTALHEIINNHIDFSYSDAKFILNYADEDPDNTSNLIQLYTNRSVIKDSWGTGGDNTNREHVWAKSHGAFVDIRPMDGDAHNLHAADASVNVTRSNYDFDEVTDGTYIDEADAYYKNGAFEPADRDKGVIARTLFYMALRYEGTDNEIDLELVDAINVSPAPEHGKLSTLLEWNKDFPPTELEKRRNERVFQSQRNRNPFIDNPTFANLIWNGEQVSSTVVGNISMSPENPKASDDVTISINITSTDNPTAKIYWGASFDSETNSADFSGTEALTASLNLNDFSDNDLVYLKIKTSDNAVMHQSFYVAPNNNITPISDVQGTEDASPMVNDIVTISGIVTANLDNSFYIQSGNSKYSGICVYSNWRGYIGDSVTVTGTVIEYQNLTEISNVTMVYSYGMKETLNPVNIEINEINEDYEGMFIQLNIVNFSDPNVTIPYDGGSYTFTSGSESIDVYIRYNSRLTSQIIPEGNLNIKAVVSEYSGNYQLLIDNIDWITPIIETSAPIANQDIVSTKINTSLKIMPLENDEYNPGISFVIYKNGSNGIAEIPFTNPNSILYTPDNNFIGIDTVQYKIYYTAQPELYAIGNIFINVSLTSVNTDKVSLIDIYPNPNNGNCTLNFPESASKQELIIYNLNGKEVAKYSISPNSSKYNLNINSIINKGYYVIMINSNKGSFAQKLIIK